MSEMFETGIIPEDSLPLFMDLLTDNTKNDLEEDNDCVCLGLTLGGRSCGAIAGVLEDEDLFRITSFYVVPQLRRMGGGTLLFDTLLDGLHETDENMVVTMEFSDEAGSEAEALMAFMDLMGIPEADESGKHGIRKYTFFTE